MKKKKSSTKSSSAYTEKILFPISWEIEYSRLFAIIKLKNQSTRFDDVRLVDYSMFYQDQDLAEATLNISLMELVKESFKNEDKYLDWLEFYTLSGDIESDYI